jgi:group I intron endonuclease
MKPKSGIYVIMNTINGHRYVGSAMNLLRRYDQHCQSLRAGTHCNSHLQSAFRKYCEGAFQFEVLEECEITRLIEREQWWLDVAQPEYNLSPTAGSPLGVKHTAETRAKFSAARKGKPFSAEHKANLAATMKGNKRNLGKKQTPETRAKHAASMMGNRHNVGRKHTAEAKANMSVAQRGKRLGRAVWNKGKIMSAEYRAKNSRGHMGQIPWNKHKEPEHEKLTDKSNRRPR